MSKHFKQTFFSPDHPKDVLREEIIEDHFHRKKHIRQPEDAPIYDEERFASFKFCGSFIGVGKMLQQFVEDISFSRTNSNGTYR